MVSFRVDEVTPAVEPLPTQPLGGLFVDALVVGGDPGLPVVAPDGIHPLLGAVGRAFAEHRPLVLSPDAVWLTIAAGVAQHVRLHAERLRPRLVAHAGRKRLSLEMYPPIPDDAAGWAAIVADLGTLLAAEARDADLFGCDFSTSTDVDRVAGQVVLLDVYAPYYAIWVTFICGIPSITLTGTPADWQKIRSRVDALAALDLGLDTWCRSLAPIADQFARAAAGDVDVGFWRRIYSPADAYGGEVITGWAARLYPYLERDGVQDEPNPLLDLPIDQPRDLTGDDRMGYRGPGVRSSQVPATLSRVIVNVNDQNGGDNRVVALHAGLVAVAQDADTELRPVAGWHLSAVSVPIDDVIDRIIAEHHTSPPRPLTDLWYAPADLVAVYRRIGAASLFDGAWRLLPAAEHRRVFYGHPTQMIVAVIDLADGRSIAAVDDGPDAVRWALCRTAPVPVQPQVAHGKYRLVDAPGRIPVYGSSLALLLDAALDSGGDISHLQTGWLDLPADESTG